MYSIIKVEMNQGTDRYFQLSPKNDVTDYFLNFSLLKELCVSSSGIYIPVKASKGKEQTRMLLPPIPAPRARPRCSIRSLPTPLILFLIIYVFS